MLVLDILDQPFGVSISIFILLWASRLDGRLFLNKENIFANSLLGITIQDSSIRERSDVYYWLFKDSRRIMIYYILTVCNIHSL